MPKIYFICGFIGSGKTTYAKKLAESESAFRFSVDEWMIPLFGEHMEREVFDAHLATLLQLFKESALQLLSLGVPVILDFGFWKKAQRDEVADWATRNALDFEVVYLDTSYEVCCERALNRVGENSYEMTPEMLNLFWSWLEPPTSAESITIISGG